MLKVSNKYPVVTEIKRILDKLHEPHQSRIITLFEYMQDACRLMAVVKTYCHNIIMDIRLSQYGRPSKLCFSWSIVKRCDDDGFDLELDDDFYNYLQDEAFYYLVDKDEIIYSRISYIKNLESLLKLVENA